MNFRPAITELLTNQPGMTMKELREVLGLTTKQVGSALTNMQYAGTVVMRKMFPRARYYASAADADADATRAAEAERIERARARENALEVHRAGSKRRYYEKLGEPVRSRPKPQPKPPKAPKVVRFAQPKPRPENAALAKWKDAIPVVPDHVKVQRIPHAIDVRFRVVGEFIGAITGQRRAA